MTRRWLVALWLCGAGLGCSAGAGGPTRDALPDLAGDAMNQQDQGGSSDGSVPTRLDFVVQGCAASSADECVGRAPLRLTFFAVGELEAGSVASWDLGDGSGQPSGGSVTHVFRRPGSYTVTLNLGHGAGTVGETKTDFVVVRPAPPAGPCELDADCDSNACVCTDSACEAPLADGFCLEACDPEVDCPEGSRCVDLSHAGGASEPWRQPGCVSVCGDQAPCERAGFTCQWALSAEGWGQVCLPGTLGSVGASCTDEAGVLSGAACLGGMCLDLGSAGYCSMVCADDPCPSGSTCVAFTSVESTASQPVCLRDCGGSGCDADPLLGCEAAAVQGDYGFELYGLASPPESARFCAPRRCSKVADDCGIGGRCDLTAGGFCRGELAP